MSASPLSLRLANGWRAFFHAQGSPAALGLFRILFAYCLWQEVTTTRLRSVFAMEGGFHLSYLPFIQPVSEQAYAWLHDLQFPFILLLGLGAFTRTSCFALLALQGYVFFADPLNFRNHPYFFLLLLGLLLLSPARDSFSLRALRPAIAKRRFSFPELLGRDAPLTFQRLIQLQVCIAYFWAALHKLHPHYLSGGVLSDVVESAVLMWPGGQLLQRFFTAETLTEPRYLIVPALLTIAIEGALPVALWFQRTRVWAIAIGVVFHAAIAWLMNITIFSLAMIASYLLFLEPATVRGILMAAERRVRGTVSRFQRRPLGAPSLPDRSGL